MQAARSQQGAAARTGLDEELQPTQLLHVPQDAMLAILDETPRGWHALMHRTVRVPQQQLAAMLALSRRR
jgi:hypothetical protein